VSGTAVAPAVTLRALRWWDIEDVLVLEQSLFPGDAWSAAAFWSELARSDTRHYVVAERDGRIVGYAGLLAVGGVGAVQTVAVAAEAQGAGVGRQLLVELLAEALRRDCHEVLLEVRADNAGALRLYERFGFERLAVRRGYYQPGGVDAHVLRLRGRDRIAAQAAAQSSIGSEGDRS
jgi:ribosomal-protein-alanine N-acetyltransferase